MRQQLRPRITHEQIRNRKPLNKLRNLNTYPIKFQFDALNNRLTKCISRVNGTKYEDKEIPRALSGPELDYTTTLSSERK